MNSGLPDLDGNRALILDGFVTTILLSAAALAKSGHVA
jgi:hypothetical protein